MHRSRMIIGIGVIVALLPLLGFPRAWESFFQILAGLSIVSLSVWSRIDRKLSLKAKAHMRHARRATDVVRAAEPEAAPDEHVPLVPPATPEFGKRVTDFYPKTGQPGRRISDLKPPISPISDEELHGDEVA